MVFSSWDLSVKKIKSPTTRRTGESCFRSFLRSMALNAKDKFSFGVWEGCQMLRTNETQGLPERARLANSFYNTINFRV